jgi:hypothetical protein
VELKIDYPYFNTKPMLCFTLDSVNYKQQTSNGTSTQLVQISNKLKGGYRFGYNTQEKTDEIAGAGNHTTAEFWEYDTRLGRRWNRDPKKNEWESDYAVMQGDPILRSDPLGDYSRIGAWWRNIRDNGGGIYKLCGEWGYNTSEKDPDGGGAAFKYHDGKTERDKQRFLSDQKRRRMMADMGGVNVVDEYGNDPALEKYAKWGFRERLQFFFDMSWPAFLVAAPQLSLAKAATAVDATKEGSSWVYGAFKTESKWAGQLSKRGWTAEQITEAVTKGKSFDAVNMVNKANSATRYVHPTTGKSVVIDNVTKELLHVGGEGFKY